ncbi:uncharacterized protein LOC114362514 [Ostrinia furnacalis]|uniref:uncharacterized protein LOC114362514 n=1 Tax=Ostrinia furnacalis TaxID=93504 RepID=UPI00103EC541|nr:uncharacterized protein LOC114362514 [Ostrinia furnacalis]
MDAEFRVMGDLKSQIEKGRINFKKSPKDRITETYVTARLEALEALMNKFMERHESIIASYEKADLDESTYIEDDVFGVGYEMYLVYKSELKATLMSLNPVSTDCSDLPCFNSKMRDNNVKLPKISIPVFNGNYSDWSSFKDLFLSLVHNNQTLDDVQRLHYLKTQLTGEAEQLIKHIPITTLNYKKCWDLLQKRYDNKRFMSNCILKRLFSQRTMNYESAQALKELVDTTSDCIHELSNLGINTESWDIIIIYIVSLKLDAESRKQWELHVNNCCEELPSYFLFKEFLEGRFRALECIEPNKTKFKPNQMKVLHTAVDNICPHCKDSHKLYVCSQFAKEDVSTRYDIVKSLGLCFNCLGKGHPGKSCRVVTKCRICNGKHHTLLHGRPYSLTSAVATELSEDSEIEQSQPESSCETKETADIVSHFVTGKGSNQTLLATALIQAESINGYPLILRALLDQGSQASFISEAAVQLLRLRKIAAKSSISGLGGGQSGLTSKYVVMVNIQSLNDPTFKLQVKAHVLNTVTSILPQKRFVLPNWQELGKINLADPQYNSPNKIDVLLGSEVYCTILKEGLIKSPSGLTIAQDTYLGWVLSGQVGGNDEEQNCHNVILNLHVKLEENELLKRFWELESEPPLVKERVLTPEEQACETHYQKTTKRDDSGRYVVELPFRTNISQDYGDTRSVAVKRLASLEKRLSKNPDSKKDYSEVLQEYKSLGHMEEVTEGTDATQKRVWLPHHAVIRMDRSTTKTRVVFNASDRSANGLSLNDTLMVGPTLQPELRHTIMRWRLHPICLIADIVKMYRQVKIAEKDVDYQRIVWRENEGDKIKDYRLLTVTFGTSCAPYLAVKTLQQVAVDEGHNFPLAASRVKTDFYMDDLLTGCQSENEALKMYEEMNELLKKGGFVMQKWASNKIDLLKSENENIRTDREIKEDQITKVVGLSWNRNTDEFDYRVRLSAEAPVPKTKRGIIAEICRLYDPLGWISPCIVTAKIFIQKLWISGFDWDDKLPESLLQEWELYRRELATLVDFHLPRWVHRADSDVQVELHGFSDASTAAYAAVVYIRCISKDGSITSHLITAKTKVAPIKQVSIPRLELCGAVLVTKLLREVAGVLNIDKSKLHAWTDSTIVLAWLGDHPSRWKTFVANRTAEILTLLDACQWAYVSSKENPADCASRGIPPFELTFNELWRNGPRWLKENQIQYTKPLSICTKIDLEARNVKVHNISIEDSSEFFFW